MPTAENRCDSELKYEKSYVAFLDVLGFKQLVYSKKKEDKKKIELYLKTVCEALDDLKKIPSKRDIGSIVISDSIILTVPFGNSRDDHIFNLRQLCIAILSLQNKLLGKDIWIRGAISCGDAHFDSRNKQIVGSAYVDAYLLEEKIAKYPRVILDNRIIKELKCSNASCLINKINRLPTTNRIDSPYSYNVLYDWNIHINPNAILDKDTPLFIDYLAANEALKLKVIGLIEKNVRIMSYTLNLNGLRIIWQA